MEKSGAPVEAFENIANRSITRGFSDFCTQVFAVADAEFRKLQHDPVELFTRAVQPVLWLVIFGKVMGRIRGLNVGSMDYLTYEVDALRMLMLRTPVSSFHLMVDFSVLIATSFVLLGVASRLYARMAT